MGFTTQTSRNLPSAPTTPTIYNVTATLADTEYSQALSNSTKKLLIRARGRTKLQISWEAGQTDTTFITIPAGAVRQLDGLDYSGSIYLRSSQAAQIIEIEEWT